MTRPSILATTVAALLVASCGGNDNTTEPAGSWNSTVTGMLRSSPLAALRNRAPRPWPTWTACPSGPV